MPGPGCQQCIRFAGISICMKICSHKSRADFACCSSRDQACFMNFQQLAVARCLPTTDNASTRPAGQTNVMLQGPPPEILFEEQQTSQAFGY